MKRGSGSGFGEWVKANVQRKEKLARIQTKKGGQWINLKEFPENLPAGVMSVQYSSTKRKVNAFKPLNGVFTMRTKDFGRKEGKPPVPKHKVDDWGNDVWSFIAVLEIVDTTTIDEGNGLGEIQAGKFHGCTVPLLLRYKFEPVIIEVNGEERQALGTAGYGKYTEQLENYLQVTGVWNKTFPYKDNCLPMLLKAILKENKSFQSQMENGWISSMYSSNSPIEDTDFGDEDTPWEE